MELLLLVLLGLITYLIVKRSVANITKTPVWLLWLVMMTPALMWTIWTVLVNSEAIPLPLMVIPFLVCPILYWLLIQWGRPKLEETPQENPSESQEETNSEETPPADLPTKVRPITQKEEKQLRNCFPWSIYYLQNLDYRPQAILCLGKLRSNPDVAYKTVKENVEEKFGDRFLLIFQEGLKNQPFFALVPNPWSKSTPGKLAQEPLRRPGLALMLLIVTLFTTTTVGISLVGKNLEDIATDPSILWLGLTYSLALVFILTIHEVAHYLAALKYKIRTTLPYFIPMPVFLGTFGAFTQRRSPIPHRKALFDVAIIGPLVGFLVTLPILIWGLSISEVVPLDDESGILNYESLNPRQSFLLAILSKLSLGSDFTADMAINLHPLAVAGCLGLVVTAINLLPIGQLDGGQIVHAMFGQRTSVAIGQVTRLLLLVLAWADAKRELLIVAIVLMFMPLADEPALNDVTELDNRRDFLGLFSLALLCTILLPLPGVVANLLGI